MRVVTAAELEKMTPAERHENFKASIVRDLDQLTPEQRTRLDRTAQRVLAREAAHQNAAGGQQAS